jgi:hypothetical protein
MLARAPNSMLFKLCNAKATRMFFTHHKFIFINVLVFVQHTLPKGVYTLGFALRVQNFASNLTILPTPRSSKC